jgi:hypothetical protein
MFFVTRKIKTLLGRWQEVTKATKNYKEHKGNCLRQDRAAGCNVPDFYIVIKANVTMRPLLFIVAMTAMSLSCKKDNIHAGEAVEIYLLKSFQTLSGKCQIDPSASVLEETAVIKNQDILEYSKNSVSI